ncbi:multiple sugar transport system substrate-binding protein [Arachidicoccus rhizosphaerae]|uniref:Multiple sugar transport system substrate-binding protein n=1 Tax=Arachidicoccus rhizosphaerae TaxID=551991 RepID=A0A1H3WZJ0_9BACT|nr:extracellular solute-binding protein [Arachidicoccus rhizosphaerae]SDZ92595.1 multiple sugar transport system substrate-binding protein [Arachidicoccus rhizosphaerae]
MQTGQFHIAIRKFEPFERFIQARWQDFCAESGCRLELCAAAMDLPELHRSLLTENGLKNGHWDIALISSDWIKEAIATKAVLPIEPLIQQEDYFTPWPASLLRSQQSGNNHFAVPFHDGPECLIYRKDLFEDPRHCSGFLAQYGYVLEPPKNWETFYDIACYFQNKEPGLCGTALAAYPDGHNAVYDFCIQAWTRGADFTSANPSINLQNQGIIDGLHFYRKLANSSHALHKDSFNMDSVKLGAAFAGGELAMMINWFGFATYAAQLDNSPVKDKIGVAPIPHQVDKPSVCPNSYWMYCIASGSANSAVAMDFIQFASQPKYDIALTLNGGIGCRKSTWHDPEVNSQLPFFNQLEAIHELARELPDWPNWPAIAQIIDEVMIQTGTTTQEIESILFAAQQKIDLLQSTPAVN